METKKYKWILLVVVGIFIIWAKNQPLETAWGLGIIIYITYNTWELQKDIQKLKEQLEKGTEENKDLLSKLSEQIQEK